MPGGSRPGRAPGRNRSRDLLVSSSRPKTTCAIFPSGAGSVRHLPGLAVKSLAAANWRAGSGSSLTIPAHVVLVAKRIGMAAASGAVSNGDCMRVSREGDGQGGADGIARPINRPLGLTVYCWAPFGSIRQPFPRVEVPCVDSPAMQDFLPDLLPGSSLPRP